MRCLAWHFRCLRGKHSAGVERRSACANAEALPRIFELGLSRDPVGLPRYRLFPSVKGSASFLLKSSSGGGGGRGEEALSGSPHTSRPVSALIPAWIPAGSKLSDSCTSSGGERRTEGTGRLKALDFFPGGRGEEKRRGLGRGEVLEKGDLYSGGLGSQGIMVVGQPYQVGNPESRQAPYCLFLRPVPAYGNIRTKAHRKRVPLNMCSSHRGTTARPGTPEVKGRASW